MSFKNIIQNIFRNKNKKVVCSNVTDITDVTDGYLPGLEYSKAADKLSPRNCAIIERIADGQNVGVCCFHLIGGKECPRHGVVKK